MDGLTRRTAERWSTLGLGVRFWWAGLATVGIAAVLVLAATTVVDATSHSRTPPAKGAGATTAGAPNSGSRSGSMAGMATGGSNTGSSRSTKTTSTICSNVKGATVMSNGMVMAPVPSSSPTAAQQAAANQLVDQTKATLTKYTSLAAATAAGYTPATNPKGYMVHYANWQIAKTDGFNPSSPAFLMYANTVHGPELLGAMYLGPAPCTPGPDIGGSLTQWHAHDNLCLSSGQVVGRTNATGTCAAGVHNSNTYFMLHVWIEPSLASAHQFQPDLTRAELAPIIEGKA